MERSLDGQVALCFQALWHTNSATAGSHPHQTPAPWDHGGGTVSLPNQAEVFSPSQGALLWGFVPVTSS